MSDAVLYEVKGNIGLITLNRPERLNAWNGDMSAGYFGSLDQAVADPDVRVIVVTGAGRGFCAGADMDVLQGIQGAGGSAPAENRDARFAMTVPKPIIAAINGACAGMGLSHALACDIRFAAAGAKFTVAFSRRGLIAEHSISWTLPRLVGQAAALDLILSGRVFLAEEAGVAVAHGELLHADFAAFGEGGAERLGVGDEDDLGFFGGLEDEIGEGGEDGFVEAGFGFVENEEWWRAGTAEDGGEADELQSAV